MANSQVNEEAIFNLARKIESAQVRADYLEQACGLDAALRDRVQALLDAYEQGSSFLSAPAAVIATSEELQERPGTRIGPYKLLEQIGEGGFGLVFMAEQQQPVRRKVAVKVLKPGMDSRQVIARFEAERQALALMDHPNIARVLEAGETETGRPFFAMELVRGVPITDYCDKNSRTPRERLDLFLTVCQAVQHAHQKGIIHRDLKPNNILVTLHDGVPVVKVIDFGIAKALGQQLTDKTLYTCFAQMIGTPLYMSPEQAEMSGLDVDTRSDIYSLGVLLYELLTGTTPFDKERLSKAGYDEMRRIIREEEPVRPSTRISTMGQAATPVSARRQSDPKRLKQLFRGELDWIVMKALEKDRNRRYETVGALARDVQCYLSGDAVSACPPSTWYRFRKLAGRHKTGLLAAALVALALVAGTAISLWQAIQATQAANAERQARLELADERAKVEARFELAQKAIALFHTGVSEDALLKNPQFKELRTKLLKEAARFYADLEKLLAGQTDVKSRRALAAAYVQLGELMAKIGAKAEALAVHQKALAVRRALAAAEGADVETRLDVARSLRYVGMLLRQTGDTTGALKAWQQQRHIATTLEGESDDAAVRAVLAQGYNSAGVTLMDTGRLAEGLEAHRNALALRQNLADANPAVAEYQSDLALSHFNIGKVLMYTGMAHANHPVTEKALMAFGKALVIWQKLADANPASPLFEQYRAYAHGMMGICLSRTGKPQEALLALHKALAIQQELAKANPAVTETGGDLAFSYDQVGWLLARQNRFAEAFIALEAGLAIRQKLTEADRENTGYATGLGYSHAHRGWALVRSGQPSKAAADLRRAVAIWTKAKSSALEDRFERSRALALLAGLGGLDEKAKYGVTPAEAAAFADQAVVSLKDAISAGWGLPDELKEADFDGLRGREDFQKLLAALQTRNKATAAKTVAESK